MSKTFESINYGGNKLPMKTRLARIGAATLAALALGGAAKGVYEYSEAQTRGTEFASSADAMKALEATIATHGNDQDQHGSAQGKMERDLRGAAAVIMRDLGEQLVAVTAVTEGQVRHHRTSRWLNE